METVERILHAFEEVKWVVLAAPMQSGKTSVYVELANILLDNNIVTSVYVMSSVSDNALKEQTMERLIDVGKVYFQYKVGKIAKWSLLHNITQFKNSLIIIDESHYGASMDSTLHKALKSIGILPSGWIDPNIWHDVSNAPLILSVSATPYEEILTMSNMKRVVLHTPGDTYVGLEDLNIREVYASDSNFAETLTNALEEFADTRTYAIVRSLPRTLIPLRKKKKALLRRDNNLGRETIFELDYPIIIVDMSTGINLSELVANEPTEFTIILVKNYGRIGQTFSKKYVSMVWEVLDSVGEHVQGLPGRCCGYEPEARNVAVYCNPNILDQHSEWMNSGCPVSLVPPVPGSRVMEEVLTTIHPSDIDIQTEIPDNSHEYQESDLTLLSVIHNAVNIGTDLNEGIVRLKVRPYVSSEEYVYIMYEPKNSSKLKLVPKDESMWINEHGLSHDEIIEKTIRILTINSDYLTDMHAITQIMVPHMWSSYSTIYITREEPAITQQEIFDVAIMTLQDMEWKYILSDMVAPYLSPYIDERLHSNMIPITIVTMRDAATALLSLIAPSREYAVTGREIDSNILTHRIWPLTQSSRPLSVYLRTMEDIIKEKIGRYNLYYSPSPTEYYS